VTLDADEASRDHGEDGGDVGSRDLWSRGKRKDEKGLVSQDEGEKLLSRTEIKRLEGGTYFGS